MSNETKMTTEEARVAAFNAMLADDKEALDRIEKSNPEAFAKPSDLLSHLTRGNVTA